MIFFKKKAKTKQQQQQQQRNSYVAFRRYFCMILPFKREQKKKLEHNFTLVVYITLP